MSKQPLMTDDEADSVRKALAEKDGYSLGNSSARIYLLRMLDERDKYLAALKKAEREPMEICNGTACYVGLWCISIDKTGKLTWRRQQTIHLAQAEVPQPPMTPAEMIEETKLRG